MTDDQRSGRWEILLDERIVWARQIAERLESEHAASPSVEKRSAAKYLRQRVSEMGEQVAERDARIRAEMEGQMTQTTQKPLPCPFCGGEKVSIREGSTYRWAFAECDECGASAGDIRRQYGQGVDDPGVVADALAEWNKRAAPPPIKAGDITITMRIGDDGDPILNFDGADDATLAPIAAAFSVAMNALMDGK